MPITSSFGIGTGMDIGSLVSQLVAAERAPTQNAINAAGTAASTKLSAIGTIRSSMSSLQDALRRVTDSVATPARRTTVGADAGFTATASSTAAPGSYEVEVISLATRHKLASGAFSSDASVGSGTLNISAGEHSYAVDIAEGATLEDIASAVNQASGGSGVSASVITADDGQHLVFNATGAGSANALTITASGGDGGLAALAYDPDNGNTALTEKTQAQDALIRVDGFERTATSNTVSDVVPGVVLTLTKANEGETFSLDVSQDNATLKGNLTAFVTAYNAANTLLRSSSAYNAETQTASALTGDSLVRGMQQQMRGAMSNQVNDLKALGISIAKDGALTLDGSKIDAVMANQPEVLSRAFAADGSVAGALSSMLTSQLDSTRGTLTLRSNSLNAQIADLTEQLDKLDVRMQAVSTRYTNQFNAMETLVAQMQSTSSYLTQQFASMNQQNNTR